MKKIKLNKFGFSHFESLIVVTVLVFIGIVAYKVVNNNSAPASGITPSLSAVQFGQCATVTKGTGTFQDKDCTVVDAKGTKAFQALPTSLNQYHDGHPWIIDEPQQFAGSSATINCDGETTVGQITSFTTNSQVLQFQKCSLIIGKQAAVQCGGINSQSANGDYEEATYNGAIVVINNTSINAPFTCNGISGDIEGNYQGIVVQKSGHESYNRIIHQFDLEVQDAPVTLTYGQSQYQLSWSGMQEDVMGTGQVLVKAPNASSLGVAPLKNKALRLDLDDD